MRDELYSVIGQSTNGDRDKYKLSCEFFSSDGGNIVRDIQTRIDKIKDLDPSEHNVTDIEMRELIVSRHEEIETESCFAHRLC